MKESFKEFYNHPFEFADNFKLEIKGNNLNIFQKYKRLQKSALGIAVICLTAWIIFGFDSTPLQFIHVILELPSVISGAQPFSYLGEVYTSYYGKEMHYSAFVIYGLMYWALSRHFEKETNFTMSKNVCFSCALMFLAVAIFEFYWIYSFAYFQNQWWVATWKMPQLRILLQNVIFLFVGAIGVFYLWADSYEIDEKTGRVESWSKRLFTFRWDWKTFILVLLALFFLISWWYYPFPVKQISVNLSTGEIVEFDKYFDSVRLESNDVIWTNSRNFPNTLYTIDLNPDDNMNAGVWFYVQDDLVHAWNTIAKIFLSLAIFNIGRVKCIGRIKKIG